MARAIRSTNLENRTSRLKLPVRRKSYFVSAAKGVGLGYRRNQGAGVWSVRSATAGGGAWLKAFAAADDFEAANGGTILDYWQALDKARSLARAGDGDGCRPVTVDEALTTYASDLRSRGGDPSNVGRVRKYLSPALASKPVALLGVSELRRWRDSLIDKHGLERASASRTCRGLRAALSLAARDDDRITNARNWRSGLANYPGSERTRNVILSDDTVRALIATAYTFGREFGAFIEVAASTGARTSQLLRVQVRDLVGTDAPKLMVPSSRKGRSRQPGHTPVPVSPALAALLRELASGREPDAPLLPLTGRPGLVFNDAVAKLGLPRSVTLYALRHSSIVRLLLAGIPIRIVANLHDTSTGQVEKTYSRNIDDVSDTLVRRALLQPAAPSTGNVLPLLRP